MSAEDRNADDPLQSLIAEILEAENRGEMIDRESLLSEHPDHAESLRDFFADHDRMKSAADIDPPTLPPHFAEPPGEEPTLAPGSPPVEDPTLAPTEPASSESDKIPAVGDQVRYFGDYELLEEIARGGMGVVFKARQMNLNRTVALKMILAGQFAGDEDVQRFYTEAEAAAQLDHPGIVPIFEIGEHQGQHYFSMGYVEGESLAQKVADGPLPPREAAELVRKICEAMAYAHERGVIHRDLKPANILMDANGQPKVTDFGLAKKTEADSNLTGTGQILGTPAYMPPEQASGGSEDVGPLADVYSLGAVLYCTLIGRPPFQSANPMDTLLQVLEKDALPLRQLDPQIEKDLETICLKCLSKVPSHRYASSGDLGDDLQRFLNDQPILARPPNPWERASQWARQHVVTVTTIMLLLVTSVTMIPFIQIGLDNLDPAEERDGPNGSLSPIIAEMRRIIQQNPLHATAYVELGRARIKQGEHQQAVLDLTAAIRIDDQNWNAFQLRGAAQLGEGRPQEALRDLTKAIELNPRSADARYHRARAQLDLNQLQDSLADVNEAITLRPSFADAYRLRGRIHTRQGDSVRSLSDLNTARRLGAGKGDE